MQQLPGEEVAVRPVGIPGVFFPLETCNVGGYCIAEA